MKTEIEDLLVMEQRATHFAMNAEGVIYQPLVDIEPKRFPVHMTRDDFAFYDYCKTFVKHMGHALLAADKTMEGEIGEFDSKRALAWRKRWGFLNEGNIKKGGGNDEKESQEYDQAAGKEIKDGSEGF